MASRLLIPVRDGSTDGEKGPENLGGTMKKFLITLTMALGVMSGSVTGLAASTRSMPVDSLNDLPTFWQGTAGGMLTLASATFKINKVNSVIERRNIPGGVSIRYGVDAVLEFTQPSLPPRQLKVVEIQLTNREVVPNVLALDLFTADELVPFVDASVIYNEADGSFSLIKHLKNGEDRFIMRGRR